MTTSNLAGAPAPDFSASVRADMEAAALDCLRLGRTLSLRTLRVAYGFNADQVAAFGGDAIAAARASLARLSPADARVARLETISVDQVMAVAHRVWGARDPCDAACTVSVREVLGMASVLIDAEQHLRVRLLKEGESS